MQIRFVLKRYLTNLLKNKKMEASKTNTETIIDPKFFGTNGKFVRADSYFRN